MIQHKRRAVLSILVVLVTILGNWIANQLPTSEGLSAPWRTVLITGLGFALLILTYKLDTAGARDPGPHFAQDIAEASRHFEAQWCERVRNELTAYLEGQARLPQSTAGALLGLPFRLREIDGKTGKPQGRYSV